jgi:hypothetical protein
MKFKPPSLNRQIEREESGDATGGTAETREPAARRNKAGDAPASAPRLTAGAFGEISPALARVLFGAEKPPAGEETTALEIESLDSTESAEEPPIRRAPLARPRPPKAPVPPPAPAEPPAEDAEAAEIGKRERDSVQKRRNAIAAEIRAARESAEDEDKEIRNLRELIAITNPPRVKAVFERQLKEARAARGDKPERSEKKRQARADAAAKIVQAPKLDQAASIAEAVRATAPDKSAPYPSPEAARLLVIAGGAPIGTFEKFYETLRAHAPEIVGSVQEYRADDIVEIVEAIRRGEPGVGVENLTRTFGIRETAVRLLETERRNRLMAEAIKTAGAPAPKPPPLPRPEAAVPPPPPAAPRPADDQPLMPPPRPFSLPAAPEATAALEQHDAKTPLEELAQIAAATDSFADLAEAVRAAEESLPPAVRHKLSGAAVRLSTAAFNRARGESVEWLDVDEFPVEAGIREAAARLKEAAERPRGARGSFERRALAAGVRVADRLDQWRHSLARGAGGGFGRALGLDRLFGWASDRAYGAAWWLAGNDPR